MNTKLVWDNRFLSMAKLVATWSRDRSTKVGAVIVGPNREVRSVGYNGFPRGVNDAIESRYERPGKYDWTEHAERNAIYNAARYGGPLDGCSIYVWVETTPGSAWKGGLCPDCARAVIQSGLKRVIINCDVSNPELSKVFLEAFEEAGIDLCGMSQTTTS